MITLTRVTKEFAGKRKTKALDEINLHVDRGELVAIVGPSGSGKSTLLNLIGGLDRATGSIVIDGQDLAVLSDDDLTRLRRDKIGIIFQFFNLLPTLNCLENVSLPLHLRSWPKRKIEERARELLRTVQLDHRVDHLPDELSGGERQRVAIARALSVYPPILLADEPTGNLDTQTGEEILKLIHELHQRLQATILIVTHDPGVAEQCQRTVKLRDGHIVEDRPAVMLFRLLSWPYLRRHLLRWALTIAGIVLGVAVFVAMHIANGSVHAAFSDTVDRIAGATQLQVSNGEIGFDEAVLEKVQSVPEVGIAVPVIEATVETGMKNQGSLLILGVDMTGDRSLRQYEMESAEDAIIDDPLVFLAQPDSLMVTKEFAARNGFAVGSRIPLYTIDGEKQFTIRGIMNSAGLTQAFGGNLAVMDIYAAQAVFGRGRRFDRIDLRTKDGVTVEACRDAVRAALGPGLEVEPPGSRSQHFEALMKSYSMATTISSLFALIVGMFIIYNSFEIAVTHRRSEIGILRALGATQSQVRNVFLFESSLAGLIGSLLGAGLGVLMAFAVSGYMGQLTEQTAGVAQRVDRLAVDPVMLAFAVLAGLATSIVAAWLPARNAAAVDPVKALQKGSYQFISSGENRRRRNLAAILLAVSLSSLLVSSWKPAFYFGYILMVVAALLFAPAMTQLLSHAIRPMLRWILPAEGTLAADSLIQTPRRTSATVAALMLSLAMVMGFGGVTDSIHESLTDWMNTALNPDLFVGPSANLTARSSTFPSSIGGLIESVPGVDMVQLVRNARVPIHGTPVMVISIEAEKLAQKVQRVPIAGNIDEMHSLTAQGKGLIVSDGFQSLHKVKLGDTVELPTPSGLLALPIVGIVRDYSDMQGSIFLDRSVYLKWWADDTINIARVYVKRGEDVTVVRQRLQAALDGRKRLLVMSNEEVRAYVFRLTDQWFSMTYNQIVVAVLVAVLGIVNTLTVSITDRRRELGVMQAVGGLRSQIRRTIWIEAVSIGIIGLVLGIALGVLNVYYSLGMVRRDLGGLDLDYTFPTTIVLWMIPVILVAAFAASLGPAESAVRGSLVEALEYE